MSRGISGVHVQRGLVLCACLLLLGAGPGRAQAARELTADECVRLGLERNPGLQAAHADALAARASYDQVRAGRLPSLSGQASYTRLSDNTPSVTFTLPGTDSSFTFQAVELNRYDAQLTVQQPLFTGFRLHNQIRAAAQEARAAALNVDQQRADAALEIRRAYWTLFRALAVRDAVDAELRDVEAHVTDVRNGVAAGTALRKDLLAAQTRSSEVALDRVEADNSVRLGQLDLNRLIGLPLDTPVRPVGGVTVDSSAGVGDLEQLTAQALAGRPQIGAQEAQVGALQAQVRAAQGGRLPQLSLVGRYAYSRPNPYFFEDQTHFHYTWELGLSAQWNIWQGGRLGAETAEARARLQAAEARLADTREQVRVNVARQHLEVLRSVEAVAAATRNVAAAEESYRVTRQQFDEGAALSSDVLDAEQAFRRAQANRAGALADYAVARATLLDALGRVW
jgi:outer membrane protein